MLGPWNLADARPFEAEPGLFAAPLVQRRDGSWALLGFRNTEPEGAPAFEIVDPIPVRLEDGRLVAART
jgi:beta-fructofuranosidase